MNHYSKPIFNFFFVFFLFAAPAAHAANQAIPAMPTLAASSYVLMDAATGDILVEHNARQELPPASLTKLMTAYLGTKEILLGHIQEQDLATISEKAWRTGGSRMFIDVGSQVAVIDLLRGIIIQSGNDASVALAEHIAGSEDSFASMMNAAARNLGLVNTNFVNSTGLPAEGHYSSAMDMAKLARAIIFEEPDHYSIYAEKDFEWNGIKQQNRNLLLWRDNTVDGLKTGHTDEAGYCLVASAERDDMRLISVVFGAKNEAARAAETQKLLTYGFRFFENRKFYAANQVVASPKIWKGAQDQVQVGVTEDLTLTAVRGQARQMEARLVLNKNLVAPVSKGQQLGTIEIVHNDQVLRSIPAVALHEIEKGGIFKLVWDSIALFFFNLFN